MGIVIKHAVPAVTLGELSALEQQGTNALASFVHIRDERRDEEMFEAGALCGVYLAQTGRGTLEAIREHYKKFKCSK